MDPNSLAFGACLSLADSYKHGHVFKGLLSSSPLDMVHWSGMLPGHLLRFGHFAANIMS